jgi:hypothetical protein
MLGGGRKTVGAEASRMSRNTVIKAEREWARASNPRHAGGHRAVATNRGLRNNRACSKLGTTS